MKTKSRSITEANEHRPSASDFQYLHDFRLVWALKARDIGMVSAILLSWLIALGEYCFQVPANRIGYGRFTGYQLKIIQECITLVVFSAFGYFYLGESLRWNYVVSFVLILAAVGFAFYDKL